MLNHGITRYLLSTVFLCVFVLFINIVPMAHIEKNQSSWHYIRGIPFCQLHSGVRSRAALSLLY
uniref:Uncharacterized protein n=1 Tax=Rhizophora mucronata TaxID=61149 RepID=A0A2P2QEC5_RHIMU